MFVPLLPSVAGGGAGCGGQDLRPPAEGWWEWVSWQLRAVEWRLGGEDGPVLIFPETTVLRPYTLGLGKGRV